MPSPIHTTIVELLEAHPEALSYLLSLSGPAPAGPLVPTTGTRSKTVTLERRVDRAYVIGSREKPEGFVLGEVQMDVDDDKLYAWALYVELARSRYRCEGALVVLTFGPAVRRWIERDIAAPTGQNGSLRQLRPRVLAIDEIPPELLLRPEMPYLAPLAVAGQKEAPDIREIAETAMDLTTIHLPSHLAEEQLDGILAMVDAALRAHLENRAMEHRGFYTDFFRNLEKEAISKGLAEGEAKGKAESVLRILALRSIPVSAKIKARVLGCSDLQMLDRWLEAALAARTAAEVVAGEEPSAHKAVRRVGSATSKRSTSAARHEAHAKPRSRKAVA